MLQGHVIVLVAFAYLGLLFGIAYYADKRADEGRSIIANPTIYALSLAVYATAWTFYGSVGRAASDGIGFLPIYLGPTLMIALWWLVMRKIIRISKNNRITSLADFIASRYGKSALLGGLVTVIAVIGILPYISLQLKAISTSYAILLHYPEISMPASAGVAPLASDTAFWVAMILAAFTILFGTRHLDAAEHHEGMVAAIAFESLVKLLAFLAVGVFVTYGMFNGLGDIFSRVRASPDLAPLLAPLEGVAGGYANWVWLTILSMLAIMFLPRQFQVAVIENKDERHLSKAIWLFPLYMIAINIFVLPIAFGGNLRFPDGTVDADTFVLTLPMAAKQEGLALLVFIGGLSAATGMVIVETIALSTMVCNDLLMPVLLRLKGLRLAERRDLTALLLGIRRGAIVLILLLGYLYFRLAGEAYALVSIGLVSFAAVAQFGPVLLGGIFWKGGTRDGAFWGLVAGFTVWAYTLLLPALVRSGWLPAELVEHGPLGHSAAQAPAVIRSGRAGPDHPRHDLEHDRQRRRIRGDLAARHARRPGGAPGECVRRRLSPGGDSRSVLLARYRLGERAAPAADALHRRGIGGRSVSRVCARPQPRLARGRAAGRRQPGAFRRDAARGRDRRRFGAHHGGVGGEGGGADDRGGARDAGRGLASHRLQSPAGAEVTRAGTRHRGTAYRQRAAGGVGSAQGRFRRDRFARAAHAADIDPDLLANPARQPGPGSGGARAAARHRDQGKRKADAPDQPDPGRLETRVRQRGVASRPGGHEGDRRGHGRGDERAVQGEARRASHPHSRSACLW
jgi:Na+/proline symporter